MLGVHFEFGVCGVLSQSTSSSLFKLSLFELKGVISFLILEFGSACGSMCMYICIRVCGFDSMLLDILV